MASCEWAGTGGGIAETFSHPEQTIREDFGTARLDQVLSKNDTLAATHLIDDSDDSSVDQVMKLTGGEGADRGYECVGYQCSWKGHEVPNATMNNLALLETKWVTALSGHAS